ncbi:MAG TPA: aspartate-semialdehyde dehydrogenase [bacterium]|nr:aspartate-semialdehyde dehydrogenase [bacterium]
MDRERIPVGILGATGSVGQKFIELLTDHPWFELTALAASDRSAGKPYAEAANWFQESRLPEDVAGMEVRECQPDLPCRIVFSGLDSSVANGIETEFANAGYIVVSNAKNHRMDPDVPLLVPEINSAHLDLVRSQQYSGGMIVTNPNCSTIGMVLALKPLVDQFGLESVHAVTMQGLSGAGYPGVPSLDILDNVIPHINGEEQKMQSEPLKIFGKLINGAVEESAMKISAQCHRVAVAHGHLEALSVKLKHKVTAEEIITAWNSFRSEPQELGLPLAPRQPIRYFPEPHYPQPKLHRNLERGMAVSTGKLQECPVLDWKFIALSHNTIRGAAGGAVLNAELLVKKGYLEAVSVPAS